MSDSKLVLTEYKDFLAGFLFADNSVSELFLEKKRSLNVNDIVIGRVSTIKKDINACFIDIAPNETAFLPFDEIDDRFIVNRSEKGIKCGDLCLVQIKREPLKTKGYSVSMKITLPGKYCVLLTEDNLIHTSSKLNKDEVKTIKEIASRQKKDETGIILRTNAIDASSDELSDEINSNSVILEKLLATFRTKTLYSVLYKGNSSLYNRVISLRNDSYSEIITDNPDIYEEFKDLKNVRLYDDKNFPLKAIYSFDKAFDEATLKKVYLPCGGYLIIEPTEALTVIDVNSGKLSSNKSKSAVIDKINEEACIEVARQLRLRNLSGIIIVDFINVENEASKSRLISIMKKELKKDYVKAVCVDFTALSLMEITREKRFSSIYDLTSN